MSMCKKCGGAGYLQKDDGYMGMPYAIPCSCTVKKALNIQAERAWKGMTNVKLSRSSQLKTKVDKNCVVVGSKHDLMLNLRSALAYRKKPEEFVKVVSDATLMSAWLSNLQYAQSEIIDPDFQRDIRVQSLEDLAESPSLLIVRLGVKMARNSAMPEVLVETIELREHLSKPTWIVEEPNRPLQEGHLSWSRAVDETLEGWERINLMQRNKSEVPTPTKRRSMKL